MSQSTELAGGEGFTFEGDVGALYLANLLSESHAPGITDRTVVRVAFQQRNFGEPLDDIIVDFKGGGGEVARLSLQAKRSLRISDAAKNPDFREIIRDSWGTLTKADFRHGIDRYGAAVAEIAKDRARALRTLCELARESQTVEHFDARFTDNGGANATIIEIKNQIATILNDVRGTPCSNTEIHGFLAHFVLIEFDFLHEGASDPPQAIERVKESLAPSDIANASLVWSRLVQLARSSAGKAGEFDRPRLVRLISPIAKLKVAVSLQADIERLKAITRSYIDDIQDDVDGTRLERTTAIAELNAKLKTSRVVQIRGLPGCGKSVLLRQSVQRAFDSGPVFFLKADQLEGRNWVSFATTLGIISVDLQALLVEVGATGSAILYIDAIDRVEKEQQLIILEILRVIVGSPLLENWRVVVSLRDTGIEPLRNWMGDLLEKAGIATVSVEGLNEDEAEALATDKPHLRSLLFGPAQVRAIVRRPFFAKVLNQSFGGNSTGAAFEPRSEIDLIDNWWARGGYNASGQNAIERQRAILDLAGIRARHLSEPIALRDMPTSSVALIDQFVVDGILQHVRRGHSVRFSHDIFFEWAYFHLLVERGANWLEEIRNCGEPPAVARVVELLSQWEYSHGMDWSVQLGRTASPQMRSQWMRAWLMGPPGVSSFSNDDSKFAQAVFANDFRFLKKALVWFQAEKTIPNPQILAGNLPQDQRLRFAYMLGWPSDFPAWRRFIGFLLRHVSEIPVNIYPAVLSVFEVWQHALAGVPNPTSHSILVQCADWLREIDKLSAAEAADANYIKWKVISDRGEFQKSLSQIILQTAQSEPELVTEYLQRVIDLEDIRKDKFEEIITFSPKLAPSHAELLVSLTLTHLKEELPDEKVAKERARTARALERRKQAMAKPESERTRLDEIAISDSFSFIGADHFSDFDWDSLSIDRDTQNFWPPSPLREPFNSLFKSSPEQALRLFRDLCNHAMAAWRQLHQHARGARGTPLPLTISFPWGRQTFWGSDREYLWSRGMWAPKPLACGFMALEEWCLAELDRGTPLDALIKQIVEGNECIAVLGTVAMLAVHTEALSEAVFPLITSQRILYADHNRMMQDMSSSFANLIGFNGRSDQSHIKAVQAANAREVRRKQLSWLVPRYLFDSGEFADRIQAALASFKDNPPFQYEEDKANPRVRDRLVNEASEYAELSEPKNYRAYRTKEPDQVALVHVSPSASTPERTANLEQARQSLEVGNLWAWASKSFESGALGDAFTIQSAIGLAKKVDSTELFAPPKEEAAQEGLGMRRGAVSAVAAITLTFRENGDEADFHWARGVLERAFQTPETRDGMWTPYSIISWHQGIFVARGLAADLRHGTIDENTTESLLILTAHPLEVVSLEAIRQACGLWTTDPKLTWAALIIAFSLCQIHPRPEGKFRGNGDPTHNIDEISRALDAGENYFKDGEGWPSLPAPPQAWIKVDRPEKQGPRYRYKQFDDDSFDPNEAWVEPEIMWYSQYAAKILPLVPIEGILASAAKATLLEFITNVLSWTIQKNSPPWTKPHKRNRPASDNFEWTRMLGNVLGRAAGVLPLQEVKNRLLNPVLALDDELCWAFLSPFTSAFINAYIYDAREIPADATGILELCLEKFLSSPELVRTSYRSGEFYGFDQPELARTLMFTSIERADGAARYVNGNWSEIEYILPLIDRYVRAAGWAASVMLSFLTLCERAKQSYPAETFADQILATLAEGASEMKGWHGTYIPERIAGLVQHFADRDSRMPLPLAQKFLRILDLLVDMGDRRSAALQLGEAFREVRIDANDVSTSTSIT